MPTLMPIVRSPRGRLVLGAVKSVPSCDVTLTARFASSVAELALRSRASRGPLAALVRAMVYSPRRSLPARQGNVLTTRLGFRVIRATSTVRRVAHTAKKAAGLVRTGRSRHRRAAVAGGCREAFRAAPWIDTRHHSGVRKACASDIGDAARPVKNGAFKEC